MHLIPVRFFEMGDSWNITNVSGMPQMFPESLLNTSGMPQMFLECRECTWKKIGMPQNIMAMKYTIRKEPKSRKYKYLFIHI